VAGNLEGVFRAIALDEAPGTADADMPKLAVVSASQGFSSDIVRASVGLGRASRFSCCSCWVVCSPSF